MEFIALKQNLLHLVRRRDFWFWIFFSAVVLPIFIINGLHEQYPDEFDNILGGWYLLHGQLFYLDWFTHHGPGSYIVAAVVEVFSGRSFVHFRFFYSILLFALAVLPFFFLKRRVKDLDISFYLCYVVLLALALTYFWGHMLLADNLSAFLLTPVFGLMFLKIIHNKRFGQGDYIFISVLSSISLLSALTYSFLVAGIYATLFVYYFLTHREKVNAREILKIVLIIGAPYLLFLLYLLLTGSLGEYLYQAVTFNKEFYIYYPGLEGKPPANPIRYAIIIAQGFHNNFSSMLNTVKSFNFDFPFNISLAVGNTALGIYLLSKRKYFAFIFLLGVLIYANARTNPFDSRETDYQSAVYIMISLFNLAYILPTLYKELNLSLDYARKLILSLVFVITIIYSLYNFTFLLRKFSYKAYDKYMGFAPLIYDRPKVAPYINKIVEKDDVAWIGPFAFEDLYYLNAKTPSKYHVFLPGMGRSPQIQQEMISEFEKNQADVIYFNKDFYILGASPKEYGQFFLKFLEDNYTTLAELKKDGIVYKSLMDPSLETDKKLFINKEKADVIVQRMLDQGLISQ